MQVHTGALQQLAISTYQHNLTISLLAHQSMMAVIRRVSFHGWND